jgi:ABC-type antimicrobial peptide transport system permease subunit
MMLGGQTGDVFCRVLWCGGRVVLFGLPFGLFLAWILSKVLSSFLFQVKVNDPLAWVTSCAVLLGMTVVATFIPALRAIRANPLDILRDE